MTRAKSLLVLFGLSLVGGCTTRDRATAETCTEILDRIVEVELTEQGFRDPALTARKKEELRGRLGPELRRCQGRRLPIEALGCVRKAKNTEEISHTCLR